MLNPSANVEMLERWRWRLVIIVEKNISIFMRRMVRCGRGSSICHEVVEYTILRHPTAEMTWRKGESECAGQVETLGPFVT
jgi:hypothetical protein